MRIIRSIAVGVAAGLFGLAAWTAWPQIPQFPGTLPSNTLVGRLGTGPGPAEAVPFSALLPTILGAQNLTQHGVVIGEGTNPLTATSALTDGQVVVGQTGSDPLPKTLSGDVTLSAAGAITLGSVITAGGPTGSTAAIPVITYDAKGRLTAVTTSTVPSCANDGLHALTNNGGSGQQCTALTSGVVAFGKATIVVASVPGTISAVNTSTDVITQSTNHGLTTGNLVYTVSGTPPTGMTAQAAYYVNALSATTYALYTTLANALADTSRVNLTAATTGAGLDFATITVSANSNLANNPFQFTAGQTAVAGTITVASAMSSTAWMPLLSWVPGATGNNDYGLPSITNLTTTVVTFGLASPSDETARTWHDFAAGLTYYLNFQGYNG